MDNFVALNSAGLALSGFVSCVFAVNARRAKSSIYLSLVSMQAAVLFLKELTDKSGRFPNATMFLIYSNFLYGIPSIYLFFLASFGTHPPKRLRHYLLALANLPCAVFFARVGSVSVDMDGVIAASDGWRAIAPVVYVNILAGFETLQLIVYAANGIRFMSKASKPSLPRRAIFFATLSCYAAYYAVRWTGVAARFLSASGGRAIAPFPDWAGSAMIGIVAFFVTIIGFLLVAVLDQIRASKPVAQAAKYGGKAIDPEEAKRIVRRVSDLLARSTDLSDESSSPRRLAEKLDIPYYLLSRSVNELCGKSVADLVREYRVERAKRLMDRRPDATILDIALESGFAAKSSFYDAFKRVIGMNPCDYRKGGAKSGESRSD
jgi:AraC-like DNA-binding protein